MAEILTRPIVSGSAWNAAGNPIIYTLQRVDYQLEEVGGAVEDDGSGNARIIVNGAAGDVSTFFTIGDTIYFKTVDSVYITHAVVTASAWTGSNTKVTVDYPFTTNGGTGTFGLIINLDRRTDWRLYVNFKNSGLTDDILPADITFSPDDTGLIRVYAQILKNYLSADILIPGVINEIEVGTALTFCLKYQEFYDNTLAIGSTTDSSNLIYAVFGAMQIGSTNGGNLLIYNLVNFDSKFLQKLQPNSTLTKMVAWRDYPFTISFLWSTTDTSIYRRSLQLDASGAVVVAQTFDLLANTGINNVHRILLPTLNAATKYVRIAITSTNSTGTGPMLTEELIIEIKDACGYSSDFEGVMFEKNPIHLWCKNSVGGDLWWNFSAYHEYQYTYSNGKKAKRIQLFETLLHPVQWEALQDFNTIGEVYQNNIVELTSSVFQTSTRIGQQVFIVNKAGTIKTGVIVIPSSDSGFAKDNVNLFSLTIELPEVFGME